VWPDEAGKERNMIIYRTAAALALTLEIAEHCGVHIPGAPYGGSSIAQLGVLLGGAFVLTEGKEGVLRFAAAFRDSTCKLVRELRAFVREIVTIFKDRDR
jgi:hypothetical protein